MNRKSKLSVQHAAKSALARVLSKLTEIALEAGVGVAEIELLLRQRAVAFLAARQIAENGRLNVSRISAATGLSRTAVSQALQQARRSPLSARVQTQFTTRVLGCWYRDPKFIGHDGLPAVLPIFGKGMTFESLTQKYGGGVPVRALLDELIRISAVEILPENRVRPKSSIAVNRGLDIDLIESIGLRTEELLHTFLSNLRQNSRSKFVANVQSAVVPEARAAFLQREIEKRSAAFLSEIEESLLPTTVKNHDKSRVPTRSRRIGVTVFYYDQSLASEPVGAVSRRRKNLKRS